MRSASHKTGLLRAIVSVVHVGRQMATAEARVEDEKGKLYAHATTTCFVFDVRGWLEIQASAFRLCQKNQLGESHLRLLVR
ncbi:hotdog fold thioesterase [Rhodoferax sp.]|uniref:hotdog fold thioesterase n=1 Tax=Rhodoferax sp. TaxID=50421 RepID=UPI002842C801|nr:hotdog fold thioesterase [Rhodoferax sp.]MDR3368241.1 hotdog fold thioesterase [Rhodoferax sp.]